MRNNSQSSSTLKFTKSVIQSKYVSKTINKIIIKNVINRSLNIFQSNEYNIESHSFSIE